MSSTVGVVRRQQRDWAIARGIAVDSDGYTLTLDDNLFVPLSEATLTEFARGDGDELGLGGSRGKMRALHSSSALACNVFEYWRGRDGSPLAAALDLPSEIVGVEFEGKFPTGLPGNPPNLDVVLPLADGSRCAIESKFLEAYGARRATGFKPKYFPSGRGLWASLGYLHSQELASRLQSGAVAFRWLHAEQLLKHILGLAASGRRWELVYLWYEAPGAAGSEHASEADEFAVVTAADGIAFRSTSYQALFSALRRRAEADEEYLRYLGERYFGE